MLIAALIVAQGCGPAPAKVLLAQAGNFGDAKLVALGETPLVVATLDGYVQYRLGAAPFAGTTPPIAANWLSIAPGGARSVIAIVGSFEEHRISIYTIDIGDGRAALLSTIGSGAELKIDPALAVTPAGYFATYTQIEGAVNNADPATENGMYSVILYRSGDLMSWTYLSTIIQARNNIEDGRLFYDGVDARLYYLFEREVVDQGHSSIEVMFSDDLGAHWAASTTLLEAQADQEPGHFARDGDHFSLYYSSDIDNKGVGSYEFAQIKKATCSQTLVCPQKDLGVIEGSAALLMDVLPRGTGGYYLFIEHYLTKDKRLMLVHAGVEQ
jgi:hypothetical protein